MKKHFYLFMGLLLALIYAADAQTILKGTVLSKSDNQPIPGATIIANGSTSYGTASDVDGRFQLEVPTSSGTITVSFIGLQSQTVSYNGSQDLTILLEESFNNLEEVVLIGYGTAKRENLSTAIGSLDNVARAVDRPITSVQEMLQGNIAGVSVVSSGGDPSATPSVVIRGMGTLGNEQPLYVVDGMPYYGGPINPNDIESLNVLKDAAAAAIYGAQASSGVIVITTKSGKMGKPKIALDYYRGWQSAYKLPEALNAAEYSQAYRNAAAHAGTISPDGHNPDLNPWGQVTRTNWMDEIFQTGAINNLNIQLSGGTESSRYSSSFGYHSKEGILQNTNYERFAYRLKSEFDLTEKFRVGQNLYINHATSRGVNTSSSYSGAIINAIYMNPAAPVYDENGNFHGTVPFDLVQFAGAYGDTYNPVALLKRPTVKNPSLNLNAIAYGEYDILENLTFRSSFSIDLRRDSYKRFDPKAPEIGRPSSMNFLEQSETRTNRWIWDQQLNYRKIFGKHEVDLTAVYSAQMTRYEGFNLRVQNFDREDDWFQYMGNGSEMPQLPGSSVFEDALTSAIARAGYSYDDRYFITGSVRRDQTSRLGTANKSDVFPAVSGAWKISSEGFYGLDWLTNLKLRASYGQIGNIQSVGYYAFNIPLSSGNSTPMGDPAALIRHIALTQQSNSNLKWERSETYNVGLDFNLLRDHLTVTADYYEKYTRGLIQTNQANPHLGVDQGPTSNVGDILNKGFELSMNYADNLNGLGYSIGANMSTNKNEVLHLDGFTSDFIQHGDNVRSAILPYRSEPGQPLYSYYLIPQMGIFQSAEEIQSYTGSDGSLIQPNARPGDLKFEDVNKDGRISDADRIFMGSAMPNFTYGFNIRLDYKNFDLGIFGQGVSGVKLFNAYKFSTYNAGLQGYNLDRAVLDAWTPDNTDTNIPVLSTQDPNNNFGTASDWYLENGSYLRIKNLSLGYTFPNALTNSLRSGASARIYISSENLFTFTNYSGLDPEVGRIGMDTGNYPLPRTFTAGINVNF